MESTRGSLQVSLETLDWPEAVVADLLGSAHMISYEKGAMIFHAGEPADLLYVIVSGEAKLYYGSPNGERLLISIVQRGQTVGLADLGGRDAQDESVQIFSAQALSRCKIAIIAKTRVAAAVAKLPSAQVACMMRQMNGQWERFCARFLAFLTMDVRSRLAYVIAEIGDVFGIPDSRGLLITLRLTHEDFGEMVGASRPMVSKHLKDLAEAGVFVKGHGHYVLSGKEAVLEFGGIGGLPRAQASRSARAIGSAVRRAVHDNVRALARRAS